jgi:periplasmic iron binding protein
MNHSWRFAVPQRWIGPGVIFAILASVVVFLALNLNLKGPGAQKKPVTGLESSKIAPGESHSHRLPAGFREYPIGDAVEKNQIRIAAVYLPPVEMEGMPGTGSSSLIHLEADIHATLGNRNGFAKDEFVPYLVVGYTIVPHDADPERLIDREEGTFMPMVARDGLHYGASIEMPKAGKYTLTYTIKPPSFGGLGRHADRATGVDPWWKPFEVSFDWDYPGPPTMSPP